MANMDKCGILVRLYYMAVVVRFRMDTSVFGVSNTVPDRPKWLIWTV